jgi:hypothetical protein
MPSSAASLPCRFELGARRWRWFATGAFALLSALALALSDLSAGWAILAWMLAGAAALWDLQRRRRDPVALIIQAPDLVQLEWPDGRTHDARLRQWRRLGPWLLLELADAPVRRLDAWWPGLPLNERRRLARLLPRMHATTEPSV